MLGIVLKWKNYDIKNVVECSLSTHCWYARKNGMKCLPSRRFVRAPMSRAGQSAQREQWLCRSRQEYLTITTNTKHDEWSLLADIKTYLLTTTRERTIIGSVSYRNRYWVYCIESYRILLYRPILRASLQIRQLLTQVPLHSRSMDIRDRHPLRADVMHVISAYTTVSDMIQDNTPRIGSYMIPIR